MKNYVAYFIDGYNKIFWANGTVAAIEYAMYRASIRGSVVKVIEEI